MENNTNTTEEGKLKQGIKKIKDFFVACKEVLFNRATISPQEESSIDELYVFNTQHDISLSGAVKILKVIALMLTVLFLWAFFFKIDEVTIGNGTVVPSSKEQVIQSLDGGVLEKIYVTEGQIVESGQTLAQLDITRTESAVEEADSRYRALKASYARLKAEVNDAELDFPKDLEKYPDLINAETKLFNTKKTKFHESLRNIEESKRLVNDELRINTQLVKKGAASSVDVIRLKKQLVELNMKEEELKAEYYLRSREEMTKISAEIDSLYQTIRGKSDMLNKSTLKSPVRGIIKDIEINTIGGVVTPNGAIMHLVPLDDTLLIEAKISPRDIAFIHPDQEAMVKITAYDYSIYGELAGRVTTISPDTIKDEKNPEAVYYRVYIRTDKDYLQKNGGKKYYITPGMIATVNIKTGNKTILQYLIKPFNKVNEALRER